MKTRIVFNGSKWVGEEPDDLATLFELLACEPLDPTFELLTEGEHAPFLSRVSREFAEQHGVEGDAVYSFAGNFFTVSNAFSVVTSDGALIERIAKAIKANMGSDAYRHARRERIDERQERAAREKAFLSRGPR